MLVPVRADELPSSKVSCPALSAGRVTDLIPPEREKHQAQRFVFWFLQKGRIVAGPVRLWESLAISKDSGKVGKPAFGFPGFPRAVIRTAPFSTAPLRPGSRLFGNESSAGEPWRGARLPCSPAVRML